MRQGARDEGRGKNAKNTLFSPTPHNIQYLSRILFEVGRKTTDGVLVLIKPAHVVSKDGPDRQHGSRGKGGGGGRGEESRANSQLFT